MTIKGKIKRPCWWKNCGERRIHWGQPDVMRGRQMVEVPEDLPEDEPVYCSFSCALMDKWIVLYPEKPEVKAARQEAWLEKRKVSK